MVSLGFWGVDPVLDKLGLDSVDVDFIPFVVLVWCAIPASFSIRSVSSSASSPDFFSSSFCLLSLYIMAISSISSTVVSFNSSSHPKVSLTLSVLTSCLDICSARPFNSLVIVLFFFRFSRFRFSILLCQCPWESLSSPLIVRLDCSSFHSWILCIPVRQQIFNESKIPSKLL